MRQVQKATMTMLMVIASFLPTVSFAEERVEGRVVHAELTLCHPRPTGGGCEGSMTLETKADGLAQQAAIKVTADTIIKNGADYIVLPATQGNSVVVNYVRDKGQLVAKSIEVVSTAR